METRFYGGRMVSNGRAIVAAGMLCSVGLLSGCGAFDTGKACTAVGLANGLYVANGRSAPAPTSPWTVVACTKAGCATSTEVPTKPVFVDHEDITTSTPIAVTATAADPSGPVAAPVTATVTPTLFVADPECGPSAYYATVTVTPTH